jgi:hypothetical protein
MEIMVNGKRRKYRITSDPRQFILSEQKERGEESKNPGEIFFEDIGYFAKLNSLFERMMLLELNDSDATTLERLLHDVKFLQNWLAEIFQGEKEQYDINADF